jgi:hypothetical protein
MQIDERNENLVVFREGAGPAVSIARASNAVVIGIRESDDILDSKNRLWQERVSWSILDR